MNNLSLTHWSPRLLVLSSLLLFASGGSSLFADDAPAQAGQAAAQNSSAPPLPPAQLDSLVAPIALYPDQLLSQILVAATYPLEIVQAEQWLQANSSLQGQALTDAAKNQNWDASVQTLVAFPEVLKRLSQDITWTTNLGNAFLAHQEDVMDAVQRLRASAEQSGKLKSTEQLKVENKTEEGQPTVVIQPASPQVVYVPVYDPNWIWGAPPSPYYPYPEWYYPPAPSPGLWCSWYPGIDMSISFGYWGGWNNWGWRPYWHRHSVIVNNTFIERNHFRQAHVVEVRNAHDGHAETVWRHDAAHRMGVAYPNRALATQYHAVPRFHPTVTQTRAQFHAAARPGVDRIGNHQFTPSVYNHSRTAFGTVEGGSAARLHSDRGYSSMNHFRPVVGSAPHGVVGGAPHGIAGGVSRGAAPRAGGHVGGGNHPMGGGNLGGGHESGNHH